MWNHRGSGIWTLQAGASQAANRSFSRPLGVVERSYHHDGAFDGVSDCILHQTVQLSPDALPFMTDDAFRRAWLAVKRRYPIVNAQVEGTDTGEALHFVIHETRLSEIREGELTFLEGGADVALKLVEERLKGPRRLSDDMLVSVIVIRFRDDGSTFHVVFNVAHLITDGMGSSTLVRTFLQNLAAPEPECIPDLAERLAMAVSCDSLTPAAKLSPAKNLWRNAVARVIWERSQRAMQGGHTLPAYFTPQTYSTPAASKELIITLPFSLSQTILKTCWANALTFGQVFPVIGQLALTRFLHRRYLRGEIPEAEWQHRLRQPMYEVGPANLRSFLNREWLASGGEREMNICVSYFFVTLPPMPRPPSGARVDTDASGAPPFSALLSRRRFLFRCELAKRQIMKFQQHPLLLDIVAHQARVDEVDKRAVALKWQQTQAGELGLMIETKAAPSVISSRVLAHVANPLGDVRRLIFLSLVALSCWCLRLA